MKLFKFTCGVDDKVGVFADEKEAYARRTEVDPAFHYLHCTITEIPIPGHSIVQAGTAAHSQEDEFTGMEVPELKEWLNANEVEYVKQWGAVKLREAARAWMAEHQAKTDSQSKVEGIARLCHEVNRAFCRSIGDDSQPSWEDAPQWQKDSAINGVEFHLNNETTPEQSHENWMREKETDGWVYGPVKDPEKKEHPCIVPYGDLPIEQRTKDYLFKAIVDTSKEDQV